MDNGMYRKVNDISLHLECPKCPVKLKSASIFNDSEKNLQLLQVSFSNSGKRAVDAIYLKLVFYDNYENIVPENGQDFKIWGLAGLNLQPGIKESDPKMLILPGTDVLDCEILITKIIYTDGEVLLFNEADYISSTNKIGQNIAIFGGKRGRKILIATIASVILLYALIFGGAYLIRDVIIPASERANINYLTKNHRYSELLAIDSISSDTSKNDSVANEAIKYYVDTEDFRAAVDAASKIRDSAARETAVNELCTVLMNAKRYDLAKELATANENHELRSEIIHGAIEYYCSINEYGEALEYASISGDADCKHNICEEAIDFHLLKNDYKTALEYADKIGDADLKETVYETAIKNNYEAGDFRSCVLYIVQSGFCPSKNITSAYIDDVISKLDKAFLYENLELLYPLMTFARKQSLFATTVDVYKSAVGITRGNMVTGFSSRNWANAASVKISEFNTVALKADGKVISYGNNDYGQNNVSGWYDVVAIAAGEKFTVGAKADGTAIATGKNADGQCNVSSWTYIVEVAAGKNHTVGLKTDGTVVATGNNDYGQCNVSGWTDIAAISCGDNHTVGLRYDGTVVATGSTDSGRCNVSEWTDIISIAAGATHTVGLHSNGTVILVGNTISTYCGDVSTWFDVTSISAGKYCVMGLTSSGNILTTGDGAPNVSSLKNIKQAPNT